VLQRGGARIDTETCMKVFNATSVNLNLHSCAGEGLDSTPDFVNPRTFELAACGAFQLVDERSLMGDLFTSDEMICFKQANDVPGLLRRWLNDPEGRQAVAAAAKQRVLREHTYRHRMQELLATIGCAYPDRIGSMLRGDRNAGPLAVRAGSSPPLRQLLAAFPHDQRVELKDVADHIRTRGVGHRLERDELLLLMLDSYRSETRDMV
jgi:spore maturation protein CgeB